MNEALTVLSDRRRRKRPPGQPPKPSRANPSIERKTTSAAVASAVHGDPVEGRLVYLREVARVRGKAEAAKAWTATATLMRVELEVIGEIRAARAAREEQDQGDEAAQIAALDAALRDLPDEQRRQLRLA